MSDDRFDVRTTLVVNGRAVTRSAGGHVTLLRWLRDEADVLDPKYGCGEGVCGACTVLVDGEPASACIVLAAQCDGAAITTAAGLLGDDGEPNPLQRSFHEHHAAQCGFCTPGMLMCASAMLADGDHADPRRDPRGAARQPLPLHRLPAHRRRDRGRRSRDGRGGPMNGEIRTSKLDELRVVHQPLARHDAAEKIAGSTRFAGDLAYAGMLHARLVRSVVPSARLTRRDVDARRRRSRAWSPCCSARTSRTTRSASTSPARRSRSAP